MRPVLTLALVLLLSACGQKGMLYLPKQPPAGATTPSGGSGTASAASGAALPAAASSPSSPAPVAASAAHS